nr:hypothetical protein [uncultured Oscillibacter sp.]
MKKTRRIASFLAGVGTALALTACLTTALAASGKVSYNFANVSLDGTKKITAGQDITAANGQKIPGSILYTDAAGGKTNYLPIRTISELLGTEIGYDSASKTILLGKQPAKAAETSKPASGADAAKTASKGVPLNAKLGDKALIVSRGGTLLPDDDPQSYRGPEKMFIDKNGGLRAEWKVGNKETISDLPAKDILLATLVNGDYPKNSKGESYGNVLLSEYVGYWPDLEHMAEYPPENRPEGYIRQKELDAGGEKLHGLSKEECPHEYTIPLYDCEGKVIGEYKGACQGHYNTEGLSMEEVRKLYEQGETW